MSTLEVNTITPQSGTTLTLGSSGDTIQVASGATVSSSLKGVEVGELWNVAGANIATSSSTGTFTSPSTVANASVSGSAQMTQSSGVFTFPSTGYYLIQLLLNVFDNGDLHRQVVGFIKTSTDSGSSFSTASQGNTFISYHQGNNTHQSLFTQYIFDVTNTSTHKVRFEWFFSNASLTWYADALGTTAYFQKLGDT
jgi:hypothetical protein